MKLPTSISSNTYLAYKSNEDLEWERKLKSENFEWNLNHPKTLVNICIEKLSDNWIGVPALEDFIAKDRDFFLQILSTSVPLQILVDNIKSDIFWKRCYYTKWSHYPADSNHKPWIKIFMEQHYAEILENMNPRQYDPEKVKNMVKLCGPYIQSLSITSLVPADLPDQRNTSPEMIGIISGQRQANKLQMNKSSETMSRDHISLYAALGSLTNLTELHIVFQQRFVGVEYRRDQFQFTNNDAKNLARGLENCALLKSLRITRSDMNCQRVKYILRGLTDNFNIETLDFSHCKIGDDGALTIAKFISKRDKLRSLILADNLFGPVGLENISSVLNHTSCGLRTLDLRLNNRLGSEGIGHLAVAIARGCNLTSLNISACGIKSGPLKKPPAGVWSTINAENPPTCGDLLARAIGLVKTPLRSLDISVNNIGSPSDHILSNAICLSYLVDINLKRSGMGSMAMAIAESAAAAQRLRREAEKGIRFRRSAGRVVQARRIVKGMNLDADPLLLAQQLSARPSIVSVASEEGYFSVQTQPLPVDFGFVPALKSPMPSSRTSSITGPSTSRRSSHHVILEPVQEVLRATLVRRRSDGSLIQPRVDNTERHIKIYVSNENTKV
ncbi:dynein regulatory complex subunit 5 [Pararge aegeria]|uniref:Jg7717 protein n=1 Tax=Pararge aegeria aegeria TaxID=348720 RepID=A0A8S4RBT0_9NEOP|nr:dynein regulatory complex subunit 5 [Pararge aegeria]CAH2234076.1 jg7717 [Pararge aegeria aegeria]